MRCEKRICALHLALVEGETRCSTCAREGADDDEDSDETERDSGRSTDEDDPSYYYEDYGYYGPGSSVGGGDTAHDPNDFTEADGESLRHEDDASFEEDLGGS
ncbi:hypothetical protein ACLESO_36405 [Pyxidicoccus sp. 3LG]